MKIIKASEIGTYQFCHRAWWYQQQGYEPENKAELAGGTEIHKQHSRIVIQSSCLQWLAYALLLVALLVAITWFIQTRL